MSSRWRPPKGLHRYLLEHLLPNDAKGEAIRGDLLEEFHAVAARSSPGEARAWYRRQARRILWAIATGRVSRAKRAAGVPLGRASIGSLLDGVLQDVTYAFRRFRKSPGYAAIAIATIAIGIGANTAMFSVVDAVILRPLPFPDPDRLVQIWETNPDYVAERGFSFPEVAINALAYREYEEQNRTLDGMAYAFPQGYLRGRPIGSTGGDFEWVQMMAVSPTFFAMLGMEPVLGRTFLPEEMGQPGGEIYVGAAILGHDIWVRRFDADPDIIGREIFIEGAPSRVVGVLPERASFPPILRGGNLLTPDVEVYMPIQFAAFDQARTGHHFYVIGRMAPGRSPEDVRADIQRLSSGLATAYPEIGEGWTIGVTPLQQWVAREYGTELYMLMGIVGFVLLVACVNLAHLLMAMGTRRRAELAVRSAIGGSRRRQVQLLLTESLLLSVLGGALGLAVAHLGLNTLLGLVPEDVPRAMEAGLDRSVLGFTVVVALATGLFFGLLPALRASDVNLVESLKGGKPAHANRRYRAASSPLIVAQVALTLVLLVGGGTLGKSFFQLRFADRGYRSENLLAVSLKWGVVGHPWARWMGSDAGTQRYWTDRQRFEETVRALPGVISVAMGKTPMGVEFPDRFQLERYEDGDPPTEEMVGGYITYVSPDYFEVLGIPVIRGEGLPAFDEVNDWRRYSWWTGCHEDRAPYCSEMAHVRVVVSESFAKAAWPGEDPIGKDLGLYGCCWTVGGVAQDVSYLGVDDPRYPDIAAESHRVYIPWMEGDLLVRTAAEPTVLEPAIQEAVRSIDTRLGVDFSTVEARIHDSLARPRFHMLLGGIFAAVALLLALVGLYGVVAYSVAQRTHEIGIRIALGARRDQIQALVVRGGLTPVGLGVVIGIVGALAAARAFEALLYGMSPVDPVLIVGLAGVLVLVTAAACYLPARRASAVDPMRAIATE